MKAILFYSLLLVAAPVGIQSAQATTFTDPLITGTTGADSYIGHWKTMNVFYQYIGRTMNLPGSIASIEYLDSELAAEGTPSKFFIEGKTIPGRPYGQVVIDSSLSLFDSAGDSLLTLSLAQTGSITAVERHGFAGEVQVSGLYNIVGGSWFENGLLDGQLFANVIYDRVTILNAKDIHATGGRFSLYQAGEEPSTEVPEPSSAALLTVAALGALRRRSAAGAEK